jgi:hypothetical protein
MMLGCCFWTTTPVRFTTSGSSGVARLTRFCTLTVARSTSVPILNVMVIWALPSLALFDDM